MDVQVMKASVNEISNSLFRSPRGIKYKYDLHPHPISPLSVDKKPADAWHAVSADHNCFLSGVTSVQNLTATRALVPLQLPHSMT